MARRRFFADWVHDGRAGIAGENAHHLTRVLRVQAGQTFEISDGENAWVATVETAGKNGVQFALSEPVENVPSLAPTALALALIKFDRMEWAIEKATELGVTRVVPVETARSEKGLYEAAKKRVERWRRIAREASEQSRRLSAPVVEDPVRWPAFVRDEANEKRRVYLEERAGAAGLLSLVDAEGPVQLLIGPEGGWTDTERSSLVEEGWLAASLGPLILRAETTVCAAMAIVSAKRLAK